MARRDHYNEPDAPAANSIVVAVSVFIQDERDRILLIRRTDNDRYAIPGGQLEPGETLTQAAVREVREETGIECEVVGLIGLYSNPNHVIAYDDGEVRQEFSICFRGTPVGGELRTSDESEDVHWACIRQLDGLDIHPAIRLRIEHALNEEPTPFYS